MKQYISELITESLVNLYGEDGKNVTATAVYTISFPEAEFGDYASNAALVLFKKFNTQPAKSPKDFAEVLAKKCSELDHKQTFSEIQAVNGFINFRLSSKVLAHEVYELTKEISPEQIGKNRKVLFEYSSPNTNKPLHIGHTRNDLYGRACINLLKTLGYEVVACEIINDRGIHIMKSVLMYMKYGKARTPEFEKIKPDHFVGKFYAMFAERAAESPTQEKALLVEAQELLQKWEAGDKEVREIWKEMNSWFFEGVKQTYEREGSVFDEIDFESEIYGLGRDLVLQGVEKGVFQKELDGSVSVDLEKFGLDKKTLLRKDGTTIYITQDLYLWSLRNDKHHPELAIVTTAAEQAYHFQVLGALFQLMEFPWAGAFRHLPYEHVYLGQDKMSSREGNTISADDLLSMVKERVRAVMAGLQRIKTSPTNEVLVEQVAFGAIKYGYLKYEPNTRIYFDVNSTIAIEGNTGPYLQYAHARIRSILNRAGEFTATTPENLTEEAELLLMRSLLYYNDTLLIAAAEYKPNLLCNYLYDLAALFNTFYNAVPVLSTNDASIRNQRLTLLSSVANVLKHGLNILGIVAPDKM